MSQQEDTVVPEQPSGAATTSLQEQFKRPWGLSLRVFGRKYFATLIMTGFFIPIITSIVTIGFYIELSSSQPWLSIALGVIITVLLWLILALFSIHFANADGANPRSYAHLKSGLADLEVHLGIDEPENQVIPPLEEMLKAGRVDGDVYNPIALERAHSLYKELWQLLNCRLDKVGLEWVLGTGYVKGWHMLHRAQEALIEFEPTVEVVRGAMHNQRALEDSNIPDEDVLRAKLIQAIKVLDPNSMAYFYSEEIGTTRENKAVNELRITLDEQGEALNQIEAVMEQLGHPIAADFDKIGLDQGTPLQNPDIDAKKKARSAIREVREAFNSFRDHTWERLLRGRNRILGTVVLTGIVTHIMLCVVLLLMPDRGAVIGAAVFYIVGAIAGLFRRFYEESMNPTTVDDYGLTIVRLAATPLLSGLAGVGGVFISLALALSTNDISLSRSLTAGSIFSLRAEYILIAALFGLAPNLIIRSLQQRANRYSEDLQSSKK